MLQCLQQVSQCCKNAVEASISATVFGKKGLSGFELLLLQYIFQGDDNDDDPYISYHSLLYKHMDKRYTV